MVDFTHPYSSETSVSLFMINSTSWQHLYPFTSHWLDLDGVRCHYLDEGSPGAPVLVMLHGNPTWSFYYRRLILALKDQYRVIVPDHIGCGLSDKPQSYAYTLAQHIQNLERLLRHLAVKNITLVLHDWGGAIGMGYAVRHPEMVERFVIFNTAAFFVPTLPLRIAVCRVPYLGAWLVRGLNSFLRGALRFATSQPAKFTPDVRCGYFAPYDNWRNRVALHQFVKDIPLQNSHPTRSVLAEIEANLPRFGNHPMLILWGADDFCFTTSVFLPEWQKRFPNAQINVLPQAGHFVVEDAHEEILSRMQQFLAQET